MRRLLSVAALEAVTSSPAFAARVHLLSQPPPKLSARSALRQLFVDPNLARHVPSISPLTVWKDGFGRKALVHPPGTNVTVAGGDFHDVHDAWLSGATLVLDSVEKYWAPVDALCQAMVESLGMGFTANACAQPLALDDCATGVRSSEARSFGHHSHSTAAAVKLSRCRVLADATPTGAQGFSAHSDHQVRPPTS